jgi:hypothetical protein
MSKLRSYIYPAVVRESFVDRALAHRRNKRRDFSLLHEFVNLVENLWEIKHQEWRDIGFKFGRLRPTPCLIAQASTKIVGSLAE